MTDFETLLLTEQKNPNAAIVEFFLSNYESENIIVLLEGEDDALFYVDFIERYVPGEKKFYFPCGGKETTLILRDFLRDYKLHPTPEKILVLVDRDFDDFLHRQHPRAFQTDGYSIENYFCSAEYFDFIVRKYTAGRIKNATATALIERFRQIFSDTIPLMIVPMSVACALRQAKTEVDLDHVSCADFIRIDYKKCCLTRRRGTRIERLRSAMSPPGAKIDWAAARKFASTFHKTPFNKWLRGKYGLQLMRLVLNLLSYEFKSSSDTLKQIGAHFGSSALGNGAMFLGDIPDLEAYCAAQ